MAYDVPTLDDFKTKFTEIIGFSDQQIQAALDEAGGSVDTSWGEIDYPFGILYLAADLLTSFKTAGAEGISSESFGAVAVSYSKGADAVSLYRSRFLLLQRRNRAGPRIV
jgi:hypothetical protein